jgi:hypothetical protein
MDQKKKHFGKPDSPNAPMDDTPSAVPQRQEYRSWYVITIYRKQMKM